MSARAKASVAAIGAPDADRCVVRSRGTEPAAPLDLRSERLALLADAAAHLLSTDDPERQVVGLYEKVAAHLGADTFFNFMVNDAGDALKLDFCGGVPEAIIPSLRRLEFGQAICGTVAQQRRSIHACSIQTSDYDKAALVRGMGIRAYCCHPLMAGDRLLGTLSFASHTKDAFDDDEVEFMRTICHYVAMAKERTRLQRQTDRHVAEIENLNERLAQSIRETHHRVRNNLQVLMAILDLEGTEGALTGPTGRSGRLSRSISSLAAVHEVITGRDPKEGLDEIPLDDILSRIAPVLQATAGPGRLACSIDDIRLPVRQISSLCFVINELVANAASHGTGTVRLVLSAVGSTIRLEVTDEGPGFPPGFDPDTGAGTGLDIVRALTAADLRGRVEFANGPSGGAAVIVTIPLTAPEPAR